MAATALEAAHVRRRLDPAALPFETTAEVPPLHGTIGQERALDAIDFGLEVATPGYNLFLPGARRPTTSSTCTTSPSRGARARYGCPPGAAATCAAISANCWRAHARRS